MTEKKPPTLEEFARWYVGAHKGDPINALSSWTFYLKPDEWNDIGRAMTYEEYLRYKFKNSALFTPDEAVGAIIKENDPAWIQEHDAIVARINDEIEKGMSEERVTVLRKLGDELREVIRRQPMP